MLCRTAHPKALRPPPPSAPSRSHCAPSLFGSLGQRKGISYLLEAVKSCGREVELTLIGRKTTEDCFPLNHATEKYRWLPSLPHHEILKEMSRHHVLVLPSLFEGFGLVILEAMAQGAVVIATNHTAAPDLMTDGVDGFVIPVRSAEAITRKLDFLAANPDRLQEMSQAATRTAARFRWENYRMQIARVVQEVVF